MSEKVKLVVCNEPQNCETVKELECRLVEAENKYYAKDIADGCIIRQQANRIRAASELVEKWRKEVIDYEHSERGFCARATAELCANELEAALRGEDEKP
jgi:hypothetical protein